MKEWMEKLNELETYDMHPQDTIAVRDFIETEIIKKIIDDIPNLPPHPYDGAAAIQYYKVIKQELRNKYLTK